MLLISAKRIFDETGFVDDRICSLVTVFFLVKSVTKLNMIKIDDKIKHNKKKLVSVMIASAVVDDKMKKEKPLET